jgi:hypothetical protein
VALKSQFVQVLREQNRLMADALMSIPQQFDADIGRLRESITAASGWCAPSDPEWEARKRRHWEARERSRRAFQRDVEVETGIRLACGCGKSILETGWHEVGCEIVGAHLCRPATKSSRAGRPSPLVVYGT